MQEIVQIGENSVPVVEYCGKRVVTFEIVDLVHGNYKRTALGLFHSSRYRYVEGEDYIDLAKHETQESLQGVAKEHVSEGILLSRTGYLILVKLFADDRICIIQRQMVNRYFRHSAFTTDSAIKDPVLAEIYSTIVELDGLKQKQSALALQYAELQRNVSKMVKREDYKHCDAGYTTSLAFCQREGILRPISFARDFGKRASRMCKQLGVRIGKAPDEQGRKVKTYPVSVLRECLDALRN